MACSFRAGLGRESSTKDDRRRERLVDDSENSTIIEPRINVDGNCRFRGKSDREKEQMSHIGILVNENPAIGRVGNPGIAAQGNPDPLEVGDPRLYTRFRSICQ